ncbi:MAG: UvrB/UvrC motif-containing protein [Phycisphaeraceae bacterium]|nr:UvrB/UvrC motif-containing protein [Phycisphaeraceae bacterium]
MKKCDHCDKPAVVHEVVIRNGKTSEVHLCAEHAQAHGFEIPPLPVTTLLSKIVEQHGEVRRGKGTGTCPGCGLTVLEFRQSGILGCPSCYDAFQPDLGTLIARAQAGATHHVGRAPSGSPGRVERGLQRARLLQELQAAVAAEQYERAARLRDRLHALDEGGSKEGDDCAEAKA